MLQPVSVFQNHMVKQTGKFTHFMLPRTFITIEEKRGRHDAEDTLGTVQGRCRPQASFQQCSPWKSYRTACTPGH